MDLPAMDTRTMSFILIALLILAAAFFWYQKKQKKQPVQQKTSCNLSKDPTPMAGPVDPPTAS
jgi:LPXTG-motif cell wall-anchored protein